MLNIPALRALKETFPQARLIAVVAPYVSELAGCIPYIDELVEWDRQRHSLFAKFKMMRLLGNKNIDLAIILNPSREFNFLTALAGIPLRVGYNRKCGFLLTHKIEDRKYLGEKHEVEYNLDLVGLIGATTENKNLSLKLEGSIPQIDGKDKVIAVHPFTSDPLKQWPLENFAEVARRISQELGLRVVIVGGKEELAKSTEHFSSFNSSLLNLTGQTTLRQLAVVFKKCSLLISGDSGPIHLAACMGIPVVAIFRNDIMGKTARRWGPWGEGHVVIEKNNLADISVDEVFTRAKEKLGL